MKKSNILLLIALTIVGNNLFAQQATARHENYGNTLNLGVGLGYYGYVGHSTPVWHADFEFRAGRDFTIAPFIAWYSYENY